MKKIILALSLIASVSSFAGEGFRDCGKLEITDKGNAGLTAEVSIEGSYSGSLAAQGQNPDGNFDYVGKVSIGDEPAVPATLTLPQALSDFVAPATAERATISINGNVQSFACPVLR